MSSIFLSHSHKDKRFTRRLAKDLMEHGVHVWIDEAEMLVGDSLLKKIQQAIRDMKFLGVILSSNSIQSEWVKKEVEIALTQEIQGKRVKVLPILYKQCQVPDFLRVKVLADFSKPANYKKGLATLLRRLVPSEQLEIPISDDLKKVLKIYLKDLKRENDQLRRDAAQKIVALGKIAVPSLIMTTGYSKAKVREWAIWALGEIGDDRAIPYLMAALETKSRSLENERALEAIKKIGPHVLQVVLKSWKDEPHTWYFDFQVEELVSHYGSEGVNYIIPFIEDNQLDHDKKQHLIEASGKIGDHRLVRPLVSLLYHDKNDFDSGWLGGEAAKALANISCKESIAALRKALKSKNEFIRASAASSLKQLRVKDAQDLLCELLLNDPDREVRCTSAEALGEIGGDKAALALFEAISRFEYSRKGERPERWQKSTQEVAQSALNYLQNQGKLSKKIEQEITSRKVEK